MERGKVFIAGPRAITRLDDRVKLRLENVTKNKLTVLVGDANGVDRAIQEHLYDVAYNDVFIYASEGKPRNNIGEWPIVTVKARGNRGFAFYAAKDRKMAIDADWGFMIWNGASKGTLTNIINLTKLGKKTLVYLVSKMEFTCIDGNDTLSALVNACGDPTIRLYNTLIRDEQIMSEHLQTSLDLMET